MVLLGLGMFTPSAPPLPPPGEAGDALLGLERTVETREEPGEA